MEIKLKNMTLHPQLKSFCGDPEFVLSVHREWPNSPVGFQHRTYRYLGVKLRIPFALHRRKFIWKGYNFGTVKDYTGRVYWHVGPVCVWQDIWRKRDPDHGKKNLVWQKHLFGLWSKAVYEPVEPRKSY